MSPSLRMTHSTALVLHALASGHAYGFEIMDATGLPGGTIYPALRRLEAAEMVESQWEDGAIAQREGRPARKYYRLTDAGEGALREAAERFRVIGMLESREATEPGG